MAGGARGGLAWRRDCAEDCVLIAALDEDEDSKICGGCVLWRVEGEFQGCGGGVGRAANPLHHADDRDVLQRPAAIFATLNLGRGHGLNDYGV